MENIVNIHLFKMPTRKHHSKNSSIIKDIHVDSRELVSCHNCTFGEAVQFENHRARTASNHTYMHVDIRTLDNRIVVCSKGEVRRTLDSSRERELLYCRVLNAYGTVVNFAWASKL